MYVWQWLMIMYLIIGSLLHVYLKYSTKKTGWLLWAASSVWFYLIKLLLSFHEKFSNVFYFPHFSRWNKRAFQFSSFHCIITGLMCYMYRYVCTHVMISRYSFIFFIHCLHYLNNSFLYTINCDSLCIAVTAGVDKNSKWHERFNRCIIKHMSTIETHISR